ncbi:MAG: protein translocase SEC61 complex subunit gamma [Candidatus Micrarchaeota archaeon]
MKIDVKGFINSSIRVLRLATKPKKEEFWTVAKITGLGIILIGVIGYIMETIKYVIIYATGGMG